MSHSCLTIYAKLLTIQPCKTCKFYLQQGLPHTNPFNLPLSHANPPKPEEQPLWQRPENLSQTSDSRMQAHLYWQLSPHDPGLQAKNYAGRFDKNIDF